MDRWRYKAFGLLIESDRSLAFLERVESWIAGASDVSISHGAVDTSPPRGCLEYLGGHIAVSDADTLLNIPEVARFRVRNGREIRIDAEPDAHPVTVSNYLFGSAISALLYQRGMLLLHGAAFIDGEATVICIGESGAGKSTLAHALLLRGATVLADDIVALSDDGQVLPGLNRIKVAQRVAASPETRVLAAPVDPRTGKTVLEIDRPPVKSRMIDAIFSLSVGDSAEAIIRPAAPAERLRLLLQHSYRADFFRNTALEVSHFDQYSRLAALPRFWAITRPASASTPQDIARLVLDYAAREAASN